MKRLLLTGLLAGSAVAGDGYVADVQLGYEYGTVGASGEQDLQHLDVTDDDLHEGASLLDVKLALGTQRLGWDKLNSYVLGQFVRDFAGEPGVDTLDWHPHAAHRRSDAQAFWLHLAYAEVEGFTDAGLASNLHLRGGRQFHWGMVGVTFDGGTLRYDDGSLVLAVRGGRRSGVYADLQDDPGFIVGADLAYDIKNTLLLRAEYMHFQRDLALTPRDRMYVLDAENAEISVDAVEAGLSFDATDELLLSARVGFVAPEISRIYVGARYAFGRSAALLDIVQKVGRDLFYDLAGGRGNTSGDRRSTYEALRLNIPDRQPHTDARLVVPIEITDWISVEPEGRAVINHGDADASSPFDADQLGWGLGVFALAPISTGAQLEIDGRYEGRSYTREDGAHFSDEVSGGETGSHAFSGGVRYVRGRPFRGLGSRFLGQRSISVGVGGYVEMWTLDNRVINSADESSSGYIADISWAPVDQATLRLAYEYATDSTVFARSVEPFHGVRVQLGGHL